MRMHFLRGCAGVAILAGLSAACSSESGSPALVSPAVGGSADGGSAATSGAQQGGSTGIGTATVGVSTGGAANGGAQSSAASVGTGGASNGGASTGSGGASSRGTATTTGGASSTGTPSSGCSVQNSATGTTIDGTMTVGGQARTYRLSVPMDYVPGQTLPLVFVFNGVGGTGPQAQQLFQVEKGHRAVFVYPTSLPNSQAGGSIAWDFSLTGVDVPYFDALVTFLEQNYCIDTSRIFALGASSGAIMANMLGCFRGDVLRAIAPSSGMTWQQSGCKGDVAVMVICGTQDTYNACNDSKNGAASETAVWLPQNMCQSTSTTSPVSSLCQAYDGCAAAAPVLLCTHPGGHGWPTSLNDATWNFFVGLP